MIFPQDQLGVLVRTHIAEQSVRFGAAEETIRARTKELHDATQQRQQQQAAAPFNSYAYHHHQQQQHHHQRYQQDDERAPSTASIACAAMHAATTVASRSASLSVPSRSRDASPVAAPVASPYDCNPPRRVDDGMQHHHLLQAQQQQQLWESAGAPVADGIPQMMAPHTELARWLEESIATSPIVLQLQTHTSRLEAHLADAVKRIESAAQQIRAVENENATLRLELQAVKEICDAQGASIAVLQKQLKVSATSRHASSPPPLLSPPHTPSSSVGAATDNVATGIRQTAEENERRQQADTQALLDIALLDDRSAAAAALSGVVGRRATDVAPKETVCDQCFSKSMCAPCSGCASEWYCSVSCALARREKHRISCDMLRSMHPANGGAKGK